MLRCPHCKSELKEASESCPRCKQPILASAESREHVSVELARFGTDAEARQAKAQLDSHGIRCELRTGMTDVGGMGPAPTVLVAEADRERARQLLGSQAAGAEAWEQRSADEPATGDEGEPYFAVGVPKLAIMPFVTFGIYELYWFYKHWACIKKRTGESIRPFWRAVLAIFWCYQLFQSIATRHELRLGKRPFSSGSLALAFIVLCLLNRLPDPYSWAALLNFLPLLTVQAAANRLNEQANPHYERNTRLSLANWAVALPCAGLLALSVAASFTPSTRVVHGSELRGFERRILIDEGYLQPGEEIQMFYSDGMWSIREDGSFFTDTRVVSYTLVGDELYYGSALYSEITNIDASYSNNWLEPTVITITTLDESEFVLTASNEEQGDRRFVAALKKHWEPRRPQQLIPRPLEQQHTTEEPAAE